jgi:hypothetical protein
MMLSLTNLFFYFPPCIQMLTLGITSDVLLDQTGNNAVTDLINALAMTLLPLFDLSVQVFASAGSSPQLQGCLTRLQRPPGYVMMSGYQMVPCNVMTLSHMALCCVGLDKVTVAVGKASATRSDAQAGQ